ncbi:DUF1906 domain-containing protein [Neobittarella massiliensis]|uniref:DUF1906 domain-containing protein n=1 Tax=Neobittarella massiliensis (ex Bilen et al. 2018) TaxID=2041842 RepID=A0A8J6LTC1_9FIRM|nr:glycoside hydrolase domain-containing protein [Neobittarella massiliensis]MBC3515104.1 DUF1906 domain-containing protein [Neobittarella massiliensis]
MDVMVLQTQRWLNRTYGSVPTFGSVEETGSTGWDTIYGLIRALQHEEGITDLVDNFGETTMALCPTLKLGSTGRVVTILQGGLWCKGYGTGAADLTANFAGGTEDAVKQLQADAGLPQTGIVTPMLMKAILSMDAFTNTWSGGSDRICEMQRALNASISSYAGIIFPCDGLYSRSLNEAIIYAIQKDIGMDAGTANGAFGPTTTSMWKSAYPNGVSAGSSATAMVKIIQYALYCNGASYDTGTFDGVYDSTVTTRVSQFQSFSGLPATGTVDISTMLSMLVSYGDQDRAVTGLDCANTLTDSYLAALDSYGYKICGRYIVGGDWKRLKVDEFARILAKGMSVFPIYQTNGMEESYFSYNQGWEDGKEAVMNARAFGFPNNTVIYFAVDFDAMDYQVTNSVIPYFQGIYERLQKMSCYPYRIGIYGPRNVCSRVSDAGYAELSFVSDMSSGFSGNLGYPLPVNWAFDQIDTVSYPVQAPDFVEIDKDVVSGRDSGASVAFPIPDTDYTGGESLIKVNIGNDEIPVYANMDTNYPFVKNQIGSIKKGQFYIARASKDGASWAPSYRKVIYKKGDGALATGLIIVSNTIMGGSFIQTGVVDFHSVIFNGSDLEVLNPDEDHISGLPGYIAHTVHKPVAAMNSSGTFIKTIPAGAKIAADVSETGYSHPEYLICNYVNYGEGNGWEPITSSDSYFFVDVDLYSATSGADRAIW